MDCLLEMKAKKMRQSAEQGTKKNPEGQDGCSKNKSLQTEGGGGDPPDTGGNLQQQSHQQRTTAGKER